MKVMLFNSFEGAKNLIPDRKLKNVLIGDLDLCVTRTGNEFYAFDNLCPHLGARLHQGWLNFENELICPLHSYRFSLDNGTEALSRCREAKRFRVYRKANQLWLTDSEEPHD